MSGKNSLFISNRDAPKPIAMPFAAID